MDEKNGLGQELAKQRNSLAEKKIKRLSSDCRTWNIEQGFVEKLQLSSSDLQNPQIAKRLIFPEETRKLKAQTDYFAFFNYGLLKEANYLEEYIVRSIVGNFRLFAD